MAAANCFNQNNLDLYREIIKWHVFFYLIQIELIHWLKHFKDKEESLHAFFFCFTPCRNIYVLKIIVELDFDLNLELNLELWWNYTSMWPVLAEYHFSPVHCYVILFTQKIIYEKWCNDALARNGIWLERVACQYCLIFILYLCSYIYTCTLWILSVGKRTNNFLGNDLISKLALSKHLLTRYLVLPLHLCFLLAHL